jgi:hypothetical protein
VLGSSATKLSTCVGPKLSIEICALVLGSSSVMRPSAHLVSTNGCSGCTLAARRLRASPRSAPRRNWFVCGAMRIIGLSAAPCASNTRMEPSSASTKRSQVLSTAAYGAESNLKRPKKRAEMAIVNTRATRPSAA